MGWLSQLDPKQDCIAKETYAGSKIKNTYFSGTTNKAKH